MACSKHSIVLYCNPILPSVVSHFHSVSWGLHSVRWAVCMQPGLSESASICWATAWSGIHVITSWQLAEAEHLQTAVCSSLVQCFNTIKCVNRKCFHKIIFYVICVTSWYCKSNFLTGKIKYIFVMFLSWRQWCLGFTCCILWPWSEGFGMM